MSGPYPLSRSDAATRNCGFVTPTHLSLRYPKSETFKLDPSTYAAGFSRDGRIIGHNAHVPYPRALPWYHDIPFRRLVDWFSPQLIGDYEHGTWAYMRRRERERPGNTVDGCKTCRVERTSVDRRAEGGEKEGGGGGGGGGESNLGADSQGVLPGGARSARCDCGEGVLDLTGDGASCYLVPDDPAYKEWVDATLAARKAREQAQADLGDVPWDVKLCPGHHAPAILQTTNDVYGNHLDLRPKPPLVYPEIPFTPTARPVLVRYRRSNMSDHPPIPDHAFAADRCEMETVDGAPLQGLAGAPFSPDEQGGEDWPQHKLQLPHTPGTDTSGKMPTRLTWDKTKVVVGGEGVKAPAPTMPAHDPWTFRRSVVVLGRVVGERSRGMTFPVYTPTGLELNRPVPRHVTMTVGSLDSDIAPEEVAVPTACRDGVYKTPPAEVMARARRARCAPRQPDFQGLSRRHPCHRDFINPELLPMPGGWRKSAQCDPSSVPLPCDDRVARLF